MRREAEHQPGELPAPAMRQESGSAARLRDPQRLAAVRRAGLLDTPAEAVFDDLAAAGARLTGMPLAFVTLVDGQRSYWKSTFGTGIAGEDTTSRQNTVEESFCRYVIGADGPVVVSDAANDELTKNTRPW